MNRALHLLTALLFSVAVYAQDASTQPLATAQQPETGQQATAGSPQSAPAATQQTTPNPQNPASSPYPNPIAPPGAVPLSVEPHHRLILQNDFTHVYSVMVPPQDATMLHEHDLPYLYVTLGATELVNAVAGQPEAKLNLQDGETHFTPAPLVHLVRTDSGLSFHNITIALVHAQGTAKNLCKDVIRGQPGDCPRESAAGKKAAPEAGDDIIPYFETEEVHVDLVKVSAGKDYADEAPKMHSLLVALSDANLDANLGGEHIQFMHGGDILWMPAGVHRKVVDFLGTHSAFLLISFKDSAARPTTQ